MEIIRPGHGFGEAVMFMDMPYAVALQALEDCLLIQAGRQGILHDLSERGRIDVDGKTVSVLSAERLRPYRK